MWFFKISYNKNEDHFGYVVISINNLIYIVIANNALKFEKLLDWSLINRFNKDKYPKLN